jgi:poly-gamma-glutamate system protein
MKFRLWKTRVYYRPAGPSPLELLGLATLGALLLYGLEHLRPGKGEPIRRIALTAAEQTEVAFEELKRERLLRKIAIDRKIDPTESGLIFAEDTTISTSKGSLSAKQTTVQPDFAALIVQLFDELRLRPGDHVAVGYTGSFPALNTALLMASKAMELDLEIVTSATSSGYGASDPRFTWLDMEATLKRAKVSPYRTSAASLGGTEDRAVGLDEGARQLLEDKIKSTGAIFLESKSYEDSLRERIRFFESRERDKPYRAYVNVGGGAVSLGRSRTKTRLSPGIVEPSSGGGSDSVAAYFLARDVPVLHLAQVVDLARHYGLPVRPKRMPQPGTSRLFQRGAPGTPLALFGLLAFLAAVVAVGRRARKRAPLGPLPADLLVEAAPSRHARPPSRGPLPSENLGPPEEETLHSLRPREDADR